MSFVPPCFPRLTKRQTLFIVLLALAAYVLYVYRNFARVTTVTERNQRTTSAKDTSEVRHAVDAKYTLKKHAQQIYSGNDVKGVKVDWGQLGTMAVADGAGWSPLSCNTSQALRRVDLPTQIGNLSIYVYGSASEDLSVTARAMKISQNKLTALLKHYKENGTAPRVKKSGGRKFNTNAITVQDTERIVQFLQSFAENHGLVLPGRVPGFKRSDVKVLPSSESKSSLWRQYRQAASARGVRAVGKTTFCKVWADHTPFIVVGRPLTDLCWHCKQNNERIQRSANLPEEEKMTLLGDQLEHLRNVEAERAFYNTMVRESKAAAAAADITALGPHQPNMLPAKIHYSFDFAQQVHLPNSPLQPGPLYFLVPRKCGIFGVCCEALPQQMNYLIDEGMSSGKGS